MVILIAFGVSIIFLFLAVYRSIMKVLNLIFKESEQTNIRRSLIVSKGLLSNP